MTQRTRHAAATHGRQAGPRRGPCPGTGAPYLASRALSYSLLFDAGRAQGGAVRGVTRAFLLPACLPAGPPVLRRRAASRRRCCFHHRAGGPVSLAAILALFWSDLGGAAVLVAVVVVFIGIGTFIIPTVVMAARLRRQRRPPRSRRRHRHTRPGLCHDPALFVLPLEASRRPLRRRPHRGRCRPRGGGRRRRPLQQTARAGRGVAGSLISGELGDGAARCWRRGRTGKSVMVVKMPSLVMRSEGH